MTESNIKNQIGWHRVQGDPTTTIVRFRFFQRKRSFIFGLCFRLKPLPTGSFVNKVINFGLFTKIILLEWLRLRMKRDGHVQTRCGQYETSREMRSLTVYDQTLKQGEFRNYSKSDQTSIWSLFPCHNIYVHLYAYVDVSCTHVRVCECV